MAVSLSSQPMPQQSRVTVRFEPASFPVAGKLILKPQGRDGAPRTVPVAGSAVIFDVPRGSQWRIECDCGPLWAEPVEIAPMSNATSVLMSVLPTSVVTGTLRIESKETATIESLTVNIEPAPQPHRDASTAREAQFTCPVQADRVWKCRLPVGTHDLSLRAKGFTPVYRWDLKIDRDKTVNLGEITLRQGASVAAWLSKRQASVLTKPAHATLTRIATTEPSAATARLSRPVAESDFDRRGYVQLAPVPAGVYVLEVTAPGFAPARIQPIQVYARAETKLRRAIDLARPITLRIAVDPAHDPSGGAWRAAIWRKSDFSGAPDPTPILATTDQSGAIVVRNVPPGRFSVELKDRTGNSMVMEEISVDDEQDADRRITVPLVRVKGNVDPDEMALPARLIFGTEFGAVRVEVRTDRDGNFEGYLPHAGVWDIELSSGDGAVHTVRSATVKEGDLLRLRIGSRTVSGFVSDADGRRMPNVHVILTARDTQSTIGTTTDAAGEWRFRAVDSGSVVLQARNADGANSDSVVVTLNEDEHRSGIALRLVPVHRIRGVITSGGGAVPGARLTLYGKGPGQGNSRFAVTDIDGAFSLDVSENVSSAIVVVSAPSRSLKVFDVTIGRDPLRLDVDATGGTITLDIPDDAADFYVAQNGIVVPLPELITWALGYGQPLNSRTLTLPFMPAANYRFCARFAGRPPACAEQFLTSNATITLSAGKK